VETGAYTIRIFVADGDPEGVRVIDRMNWTGTGTASRIRAASLAPR
jgi:hypothetical protein